MANPITPLCIYCMFYIFKAHPHHLKLTFILQSTYSRVCFPFISLEGVNESMAS